MALRFEAHLLTELTLVLQCGGRKAGIYVPVDDVFGHDGMRIIAGAGGRDCIGGSTSLCVWFQRPLNMALCPEDMLAEQIIKPHAISELFSPLYEESRQADDWMIGKRPLLAHYTSIQSLEKTLEKEELWLSNPLFMNDLDELRFGMIRGKAIFDQTDIEKECGLDAEKAASIREAFNLYYSDYENKHALNVYILCLSEHDVADTDGILSMWRAYANNGNGAAIVFDTKVIGTVVEDSPFVLVKVRYASTEERLQWLQKTVWEWCQIVAKSDIPPDLLWMAAYQLFT